MRPRQTTMLYQTAARAWLTVAIGSLALPVDVRHGVWLPLHLTLAGAVSVAISGSMQTFSAALTASGPPTTGWTVIQFALVNVGAASIAVGRSAEMTWLVAVGGATFVVAIAVLGAIVVAARRRAVHRRHDAITGLYLVALGCVVAGGAIGAVMGSGRVGDAGTWIALRRTHVVLNVLGWASLTIAATLVTMMPAILRIRMPRGHTVMTMVGLVGGLALLSTGFLTGVPELPAAGGLLHAVGAIGVGTLVAASAGADRRWAAPTAALHLVAASVWFVAGSVALFVAVADGPGGFDRFRDPFLLIFVGGWIVQILLGAWSYLVPMARPGHPDDRRRILAAMETGGRVQVAAGNAGLLLLVARAAGWVPSVLGWAGAAAALAVAAFVLTKVWAAPAIAAFTAPSDRARAIWGSTAVGADRAPGRRSVGG